MAKNRVLLLNMAFLDRAVARCIDQSKGEQRKYDMILLTGHTIRMQMDLNRTGWWLCQYKDKNESFWRFYFRFNGTAQSDPLTQNFFNRLPNYIERRVEEQNKIDASVLDAVLDSMDKLKA